MADINHIDNVVNVLTSTPGWRRILLLIDTAEHEAEKEAIVKYVLMKFKERLVYFKKDKQIEKRAT